MANLLNRVSGPRTRKLGDLTISYVPDGSVQLDPRGWLPATTEADWAARPEYLDADGFLTASIGGLLVEHGDRALLIDSGVGPVSAPNDPGNPLLGALNGGALLDNLAALGRRPEDVEALTFTHMHPDHVGWHHAFGEVLVAEPEWAERHQAVEAETVAALAPRVRTIADGEEIFPGVRMELTAGHTAGHAAFAIASGGQRLLAFGDALHSPVQVEHPEWSAAVDHDPEASARQRAELVADLESSGDLGFGIHFADALFGRVRNGTWHPEPDVPS